MIWIILMLKKSKYDEVIIYFLMNIYMCVLWFEDANVSYFELLEENSILIADSYFVKTKCLLN